MTGFRRTVGLLAAMLASLAQPASAQVEFAEFNDEPPSIVEELGIPTLETLGIPSPVIEGACVGQCCDDPWCNTKHRCRRCMLSGEQPKYRLGGWLEQGMTLNFDSPANRQNGPVLFNDRANEYMVNQAYTFFERQVVTDGCNWDFGGRVDLVWGTDQRFLTAIGLETHEEDGSPRWNSENHRFYGLAMPQLYTEVGAPVGEGLSVKFGHFYTIMGFEALTAPDNFFYSHALCTVFGEPFTHTGVLASLKLKENLFFAHDHFTLYAGITRGWNTWQRPGNDYGVLAGVTVDIPDQRSNVSFSMHVGEEPTEFFVNSIPLDASRVAWSAVYRKEITDCLTYVLQHDGGIQQEGSLVADQTNMTTFFDYAKWYGLNNYLFYEINPKLSAVARLEWFRDQDNARIARLPVRFIPGGNLFLNPNYYNFTLGLNWKPKKNLMIRPELRFDWSGFRGNPDVGADPAVRAYDDSSDASQMLWATDVVWTY